jgi:hypothetical protein
LGRRLWLSVGARAVIQRPGTRERRVAPPVALFVPAGATAWTVWDPGDYLALDVAPLYRFTERFAAGVTLGYAIRGRDRSTYETSQDSIGVAQRLGAPVPAAVLDGGTGFRRLRVGAALTYVGPRVEAGVSFERTVSAAIAANEAAMAAGVPAAARFRIVVRIAQRLF